MRLAYDISAAYVSRTGIAAYVVSLLEELRHRRELDVSMWALAARSRPLPASLSSLPVRRLRLPGRLGPRLWSRARFPRGELLTGPADVVHGTNFWIPPLSKSAGVITIHDLTFIHHPELCSPTVRDYRNTLPLALRSCRAVITVSETVRADFLDHFEFPPERVVVAHHGIHSWIRNPGAANLRIANLRMDGDYVLFVGGQDARKNLTRLINAMAKVAVKLVLVGPNGDDTDSIRTEVSRLSLQDSVVFAGSLPDGELAAILAGARAFVFPSIDEGFGMPPLEAMSAGVPVVAAQAGSLPEILGDAPIWCDPYDIASIASAIDIAVSDESRRTTAISKGRERAAGFSWERSADRTIEAYLIAAS